MAKPSHTRMLLSDDLLMHPPGFGFAKDPWKLDIRYSQAGVVPGLPKSHTHPHTTERQFPTLTAQKNH